MPKLRPNGDFDMVSKERTEPECVLNRYWVWVLDAAVPVRGAGTETEQDWSLKQYEEERRAESTWQQQQQLKVDAVVDMRPEVSSWLGSSVERDELPGNSGDAGWECKD